MDYSKEYVAQLLLQLLSNKSPDLGARLKQKLNSLLSYQELPPFDEKLHGYKRFKDFLADILKDQIEIQSPSGPGDILVYYKPVAQHVATNSLKSNLETKETIVIRNDIWQAFTNPDKSKKRYIKKSTLQIRFINNDGDSSEKSDVELNNSDYLEIHPISGEDQTNWMRIFLNIVKIPASQKPPLISIIEAPYTSVINATFSRALGDHGNEWKAFRTNNVLKVIRDWSEKQNISIQELSVSPDKTNNTLLESSDGILTDREKARKLLSLISDEDISLKVLPALLNVFLLSKSTK